MLERYRTPGGGGIDHATFSEAERFAPPAGWRTEYQRDDPGVSLGNGFDDDGISMSRGCWVRTCLDLDDDQLAFAGGRIEPSRPRTLNAYGFSCSNAEALS